MVKTVEILRFEKCPQEKLRNKKTKKQKRNFITSELRSRSKNEVVWSCIVLHGLVYDLFGFVIFTRYLCNDHEWLFETDSGSKPY